MDSFNGLFTLIESVTDANYLNGSVCGSVRSRLCYITIHTIFIQLLHVVSYWFNVPHLEKFHGILYHWEWVLNVCIFNGILISWQTVKN